MLRFVKRVCWNEELRLKICLLVGNSEVGISEGNLCSPVITSYPRWFGTKKDQAQWREVKVWLLKIKEWKAIIAMGRPLSSMTWRFITLAYTGRQKWSNKRPVWSVMVWLLCTDVVLTMVTWELRREVSLSNCPPLIGKRHQWRRWNKKKTNRDGVALPYKLLTLLTLLPQLKQCSAIYG